MFSLCSCGAANRVFPFSGFDVTYHSSNCSLGRSVYLHHLDSGLRAIVEWDEVSSVVMSGQSSGDSSATTEPVVVRLGAESGSSSVVPRPISQPERWGGPSLWGDLS